MARRAVAILVSTLFWVFLISTSIVLYGVAVVIWLTTALFDRRRVILHRFTCFWASLYTWSNPAWPTVVEGREHIDPRETYVMVANHLSLLDILVLFRLFRHFKWVSKEENFRLPFIGWNMGLNRYVKLRRGDRTSVMQMMRSCRENLADGNSLMIFPEGTRSPTGRLRSFKTGAFELALSCQRPVLPIVLHGTHDALPKEGLVMTGRHPIRVQVLPPLPYESFAGQSPEELAEHVRGLVAEQLPAREKKSIPA